MDYNVRYNIDINGDKASKSLNDFQNTVQKTVPTIISSLEQLRKEIGKINSSFTSFKKLTGTGPKKIKFTIDNKVSKEIKSLQKQINSLKGKTVTVNTKVTQTETTGTRSKTTKIPKMVSPLDKGNNRAARGFGDGVRGLFGLSDLMYSMGFPFPNMIGTASIGMGVMSILKSATEYENIMTTVQSILKTTDKDAATFDQRFQDMSKHIRQVGVDTKFTTTEVAGAAKYLAMAGLNIEDINHSIKPIANLAIIGDAPLDRMADIVTNIQTAYGIDSSKMGQVSDILTSITTSTNTNVLEMGEAMKFAAPMMSMAQISFNEASAAIGALANAGLKGTVAGTALRAMMTRLLNPTKKGTEVLKKYNVQLYELDKATGKNKLRSLLDIFSQLKAKDASVQDLIKIFDKIGGNAANNVFSELLKLPELIKNSVYSVGIAEDIATEKQNTIQGKWDKVTSQFTETGMNVFEAFNPIIKNGLDDLLIILQQPGTAQMFKTIASGLVTLTKTLIGIAQWVSDNWYWLESFVISGFLAKKIYAIGTAIAGVGSSLMGAVKGFRALTTSIGIVGASGGTAAAGGLLASLGAIPVLVATAIAALASLGISVYGAGKQTEATIKSVNDEYKKLSPIFKEHGNDTPSPDSTPLAGSKYYDSLGYNLGVRNMVYNGDGSMFPQFERVLKERGELEGAKIADKYILTALSLENFGSGKIKSLYNDIIDDMLNQKRKPSFKFSPSYYLTEEEKNNGITIIQDFNKINAETEQKTQQFTEGVNHSIDLGLSALNKIIDIQLKASSKLPISTTEAIDFIKSIEGTDLSAESLGYSIIGPTGEYIFNDKEKAKKTVQATFSNLRNKGAKPYLIQWILETLPAFKEFANISELYSSKYPKIENDTDTDTSSNLNGTYSGTGKSTGNTPKQIIINIDALMKNVTVNSDSPEDMESFKNKMAQALIDVVKDFEISYS